MPISVIRRDTPLLRAMLRLELIIVVSLNTTHEERFDIVNPDNEIDSDLFATVGSLVDFVHSRAAR